MLRSAQLKSGQGIFCVSEANRSYRPELRDTAMRLPRWARTRIRESLERSGSLPLCNPPIANLIDPLKATLPALLRMRRHARRRVQEIVPRDVRSQEMRQEPLFLPGSDSYRKPAYCRHLGSPDESIDPVSAARPRRRAPGHAFRLDRRESGSCDIALPERRGHPAVPVPSGYAKTGTEWERRSTRP